MDNIIDIEIGAYISTPLTSISFQSVCNFIMNNIHLINVLWSTFLLLFLSSAVLAKLLWKWFWISETRATIDQSYEIIRMYVCFE